MTFTRVEMQDWPRREAFEHYFREVPCSYSAVFRLDITRLRRSGKKLYPSMLYRLATVVNRHQELRMALDGEGKVGFYDVVHPCYTVFHPQSESFSNLWTRYDPDEAAFFEAYERDLAAYGKLPGMNPKPGTPPNCFPVSMVPWASFQGFNLNLQKGYDYLSPIFTMGKFEEEGGKILLPLAVQLHHAVCDGFHLCRLVNELQDLLQSL